MHKHQRSFGQHPATLQLRNINSARYVPSSYIEPFSDSDNPQNLIDVILSQNYQEPSESSVFTNLGEDARRIDLKNYKTPGRHLSHEEYLVNEFASHIPYAASSNTNYSSHNQTIREKYSSYQYSSLHTPLMSVIYPRSGPTTKYVAFDMFEQVVNKMWTQVQRIQTSLSQIQEKQVHLDQRLHMIETTKPGESDKTIRVRSAVKSRKDSTPDALEPFKALRKEMQQQFLGIDQQIQKFLTQGKDIQGRLSLLQEKIQSNQGMVQKYEEQVQIIQHKFSITKEECDERVQSIQETVKVSINVSNETHSSMQEMKEHVFSLDQDLLKTFQQVKGLLDLESRIDEQGNDLSNVKVQVQQTRRALQEISNYLSIQ